MSENKMGIKNSIIKIIKNVLIGIIVGFLILEFWEIYKNNIDKFHEKILRMPSENFTVDLTTNFKIVMGSLLDYVSHFIWSFVILSLTVFLFKGKETLKEYFKNLVKIYSSKLFFFLFLEGILIMLLLSYTVVMFPVKSAIKVEFGKFQRYYFWSKVTGYINIFYLIQYFIVAIMEETIFRGVIYRGLSKATTKIWSAVVTSLTFSAYHVYPSNPPLFIIRNIVISLILIYMLEKTGTIWWSVGMHFGLNVFLFDRISQVEGQTQLAIGIIIVFSAYMILDYLIQWYFSKKEQNGNLLESQLKDKRERVEEEMTVECLS
ncbi:CPBP family intramembrane glutamic endopeptidase [Caldicellulosiruptor morganii]|uniref:CPBP family intramembrane metalloprotease n=1 Tax=Caldicellulosiruptor morganii TaxID=1387555 RepID=A0ABY7BPJ9_9FIRM|nr:type II CAAX endopeptidase family protein [Caldicellulosiruptor morganii]WAM33827.1 CPBP family intramembrane metalloprotease [Caldicellulosiruptor morganii]